MNELGLIICLVIVFVTLFVVLLERKLLAYAQRRMGPAIMGRNGVFQIVLDLFKLLTKEIFIIPKPTSYLAPICLALLYSTQLIFSQNFIFGPSFLLFTNVDSLILYHLVLIIFSNIFLLLVGFLSQSRYAIIGTVRAIIHTISLDIFVTVIYSFLIFISQSANFHDFVLNQNCYWFIFLYSPAVSIFVLILLLESKRAPFDHSETESEVVSGYAVEYSGPMLLVFYLAEYLHLVIASVHFIIFFFGGWLILNIFTILPPIFLNFTNINYWNLLFAH